jgi:hypothetical protein
MGSPVTACRAVQYSDSMVCDCGLRWDTNDPYPPLCPENPALADLYSSVTGKPTMPVLLRSRRPKWYIGWEVTCIVAVIALSAGVWVGSWLVELEKWICCR